jgi:hypothetical protein
LNTISETLIRNLSSRILLRREVLKKKLTVAEPRCENCGEPIDQCKCVCPYCGETDGCTCCIGSDKVTGG